jgi:hypothetical protein
MGREGPKTRVFISYAHKDDSELAYRLCTDLARVHDAVWLDKDRVIDGSDWSEVIEKEIDSADVIKAKNENVTLRSYFIAHTSLPWLAPQGHPSIG